MFDRRQLKERILQTDQLKNVSKRLQHRIDHILSRKKLTNYNQIWKE